MFTLPPGVNTIVAVHEAGHASMAVLTGRRLVGVVGRSDADGTTGVCLIDPRTGMDDTERLVNEASFQSAGVVAGMLAAGPEQGGSGGRHDFRRYDAIMAELDGRGRRPPNPFAVAHRELSRPRNWAGVVRLTELLIATGCIAAGPLAEETIRAGFVDLDLQEVISRRGKAIEPLLAYLATRGG